MDGRYIIEWNGISRATGREVDRKTPGHEI